MSAVQLLIEAILVGMVLVILGNTVAFLAPDQFKVKLNRSCSKWNDNHIFEFVLFTTGFLGHLGFELVGVNGLYCRMGNACQV